MNTPKTPAEAGSSRNSGRDEMASCSPQASAGLSPKRKIAAGAAAAALLVGATTGTVAAANAWIVPALDGEDVIVSGCVIRFSDPSGAPSIYANAAHVCAGVESVGITPQGRLRIVQSVTDVAQNPVLFGFAQTDETLAGRGITCGASGGTDDTEYVCFDARINRALDLSNPSDLKRMQGKYSNMWVGWVHAPN